MACISMTGGVAASAILFSSTIFAATAVQAQEGAAYSSLVAGHAATHGLPPSLVHRVIMRESRYNARAVSRGNYGLMQIRLGTARAMGYSGSAAGLLDPNVNMTYAVKYLAGAYRAAGGNPDRAVALYARGYHDVARRQRAVPTTVAAPAVIPLPPLSPEARSARGEAVTTPAAAETSDGVTTSREHEVR